MTGTDLMAGEGRKCSKGWARTSDALNFMKWTPAGHAFSTLSAFPLGFPHQFLIPTRLSETLGKIFSKINFSHHLTQTTRLCDPALSTNVTTLSLFRLRFYNHPALCQGFPVLPPPVWVILWCHSPRFMMLANVVSGMTIDRTSLRPSCETSHTVFCLLPPHSSMM